MNFVQEMSDEQINSIISFVDNNDASDLRNMPSLSMREEVLAFRIYLKLNDNRNHKGLVASKYSCDSYIILNLNGTIYFVEENSGTITKYYLLNNDWHNSLEIIFKGSPHLYGNINDIRNIND